MFHVILQLQSSMQSILVTIFRIGRLWLSAGTYEATSLAVAAAVRHLQSWAPQIYTHSAK